MCSICLLGVQVAVEGEEWSFLAIDKYDCPRSDFAQKAKSRGGTVVTRAYIKKRYLQLKYTVSMPEKIRFA